MTVLTEIAKEKSTYVVTCVMTDSTGAAVIPSSITWTLSKDADTIINDRENVEVSVPASTIKIVLSGNDLAVLPSENNTSVERILTVNAVYDSDLGSNLPIKDSAKFWIENITNVA